MKQSRFLLIILLFILFFTGCHREQKLAVAEKLQEKYGEEFTVVDARYSVMTQTYNFKAYPKSDRSIEITGIYNQDFSYFSDSYTSQLISENYRSYLRGKLEEADYYWDSKSVSPEDSPAGVFHLDTHLMTFDDLQTLPAEFTQDYTFAHYQSLSLDMVVDISSEEMPLGDHRGLEIIYEEYLRLLEYDDSFFSLRVNIWDKGDLTAYLLREMRKGRGIAPEFHPQSILNLYVRTDEYAAPLNYADFLRYLQDTESVRDYLNLNEMMKLNSFRIKTLQRIILTDYNGDESHSMEIYRGFKEGQLFSTLYMGDEALKDNLECYRFLQLLEQMKSPERVSDPSGEWILKRQWIFQEKEVESSLKMYQNAKGEWFGTNSSQPGAFRLPPEHLESLLSFPYLP